MTTRNQIQAKQAVRSYTRRNARQIVYGALGNNAGTVDHATRNDWVYVRLHGDSNQVVEAYAAESFPHVDNLIVDVEKVLRKGAPYYQIMGVSAGVTYSTTDNPFPGLPGTHGIHHQRRDRNTGGFDPVDIYNRALVNLRARAQATPDMTLYVERGFYVITSFKEWAGGNSAAFTACPPLFVRWDLLYLGNDDALHILEGTAVISTATPTYPTVPANCIPIAYVYRSGDQTYLDEADITDARTILSSNQATPAAHDMITSHTYTGGAALDVFGLSAASTIARLTPSSNPGAASAILKSDASGNLRLQNLTLDAALNFGTYIDLPGIANPAAPAAGHVRFHAATTQGFTRFEQDNEATTNLVLGRDNVFIAKNTSGSPIAANKPVYVTGSTGNVPNIALAKADSITTLPAIGVTLDAIGNNNFGQVMKLGVISSVDTSAFLTGDQLWVSAASAGALVSTRPAYPNLVQRIGSVLVSGVGNGSILVTVAPFIGGQESGTTATTWTGAGVLNLAGTSNQIVLQSAGVTGTLTWTPTSSGKVITLPDLTGTVALGAGTATVSSTNSVTVASHTHAITSSSNPGAAASILASGASGELTLAGTLTVNNRGVITLTQGALAANTNALAVTHNYTPTAAEGTYAALGMVFNCAKYGTFNDTAALGIRGVQGQVQNSGSGNVTDIAAITAIAQNLSTGTVSNGYGAYIFTPTAAVANPMTTAYGLYISAQATTGVTNAYALYQAGTGDTNTFLGGVVCGAATGGNKGAGTINTAADIYKNNSAYGNPAYALEHWATGRIVKHADKEGAAGYKRLTLAETEQYIREHYELPGHRDDFGLFGGGDWMLEKIEELTTHVIELHHRIERMGA